MLVLREIADLVFARRSLEVWFTKDHAKVILEMYNNISNCARRSGERSDATIMQNITSGKAPEFAMEQYGFVRLEPVEGDIDPANRDTYAVDLLHRESGTTVQVKTWGKWRDAYWSFHTATKASIVKDLDAYDYILTCQSNQLSNKGHWEVIPKLLLNAKTFKRYCQPSQNPSRRDNHYYDHIAAIRDGEAEINYKVEGGLRKP